MSVPLDRLYHFLEGMIDADVIIYRYYPHGAKNIDNLKPLRDYNILQKYYYNTHPLVICHDQEPLCYHGTSEQQWHEFFHSTWPIPRGDTAKWQHLIERGISQNLRAAASACYANAFDVTILVHSELRSSQVLAYRDNQFLPCYYWSHGIIARDWFRYAKHDPCIGHSAHDRVIFLIYNRAWQGSREYRLWFVQKLVQNDLIDHCMTWFNAIDNGLHYTEYQFTNSDLSITDDNLEKHFAASVASSTASADYAIADYLGSSIEIVLETLADDERLHLTEKTLRPIAMAQPFMLVSTMGSLQYLRNYGFRTFGDYIDESYDNIPDTRARLTAIVSEMQRIRDLPRHNQQQLVRQCKAVATFNRQHFFSHRFWQMLTAEYRMNMESSLHEAEKYVTGKNLMMYLSDPLSGTRISVEDREHLLSWLQSRNQML